MRTSFRGLGAAIALALLVVSCTKTGTATPSASASAAASVAGVQPVRGGTLTLVTDGQPATYDAHIETAASAIDLLAPEYSLLYRFDAVDPARFVPDLATGAITYSSDKLTATVKIRDGVKFADGGALTSADVVATYQKILGPGSARRGAYAMIDSVSAPDPTTVTFKLKSVSASFAELLASPWNVIYSAAKLKEDPKYYETHVDGSGPFVFVSNAKGSEWVAKRNDAYYAKDASGAALPYLDGLRYLIIPDAAARVDALKTKKASVLMRGVTPAQRDDIARALPNDLALQEAASSCVEMLIPNVTAKPFDDVRVRQAISEAIDRRGQSTSLEGKADVKDVGGLMRPGSLYAMSDGDQQKVRGFGTDTTTAQADVKKLLGDAGQTSLSFKLLTGTADIDAVLASFLIDQWKTSGITVTRDARANYRDAIAGKQFQVALDTSCTFMDEPDLVLPPLRGAFNDTKLDGLIDAQTKETDLNKRTTAVGDIERYVLDEKAYLYPVIWRERIVPYLKSVRGWRIAASDGNGEDLTRAWIAP